MKKLKLLTILAFAGLALTACDGASLPISSYYSQEELEHLSEQIDTPWVDYSVPATSVSFPENELHREMLKGETYTYNPRVSPINDMGALIWQSSNENIVSVDKGTVTAVSGGQATIVVSSRYEGFTPVELKINVTTKITDFIVTPGALDLDYNESAKLSVAYVPEDTTQLGVNFEYGSEADKNIISISEDGTVTALKVSGNAKVKVTSPFINTVREVNVTVSDKSVHVNSVKFTNKVEALELGKTANIYAEVTPEDAVVKGVIYTSSNPEVATISELGIISAIKEGNTIIRATAVENESIFAEYDLHVFEVKAATMEPVEPNLVIALGGYQQITLIYKSSEGLVINPSKVAPTYESSDTAIATVDAKGLVTAKNIGEAVITIKDGELTAHVNVKVEIEQREIIITGLPTWIEDSGCVVMAWIWGGNEQGSWRSVSLTGSSGKFKAPKSATKFLLARCIAGTNTDNLPDWDVVGDNPGRIYNKTADLDIITSATSYDLPESEWVDYPEMPASGYGFMFKSGRYVVAEAAGEDDNGKEQYKMDAIEFTANEEFALYNFKDKAGWTEPVEGWSFGGTSAEDNNWKQYLEIDEDKNVYRVLQDFTADVFIKIKWQDNSIYFGLVGGEPSLQEIALDKSEVTVRLGESATIKASNYEGELTVDTENHAVATATLGLDGEATIYGAAVGTTNIIFKDDTNRTAKAKITVKELASTRDVYLNTKGELEKDNATLFIHAWNQDGYFTTQEFEAVSGQTIIYKATVSGEATDCLIARCQPGSTDIIWDENVWNTSGNIIFCEYDLIEFNAYDNGVISIINIANFDPSVVYTTEGEIIPEPTEPDYKLFGVEGDWENGIELVKEGNLFKAQNIEIAANTGVKVHNVNAESWNDDWYGVNDDDPNGLYKVDSDHNAVIQNAAIYDVTFNPANADGNFISFTKVGEVIPPEPVEAVYALYGVTDWTAENAILFTQDTEDTNLYVIEEVFIHEGTGIKVHNKNADSDKEWYGVDHAYDGCGWTVGTAENDGNAMVIEDGTYKVKFYLNSDDGNHIVIEKQGGDVPPEPPVVEPEYRLFGIDGDWAVGIELVKDGDVYIASEIELAANTNLKAHNKNADADKEWYGIASDDAEGLVKVGEDGNAVIQADGTYTITLNLAAEDGNYLSFVKKGGDIPPEPPVVDPVYALYGVIDWTAENAIVLTQDSEDKNLFTAENIEIAAGKGIKVHNKNADSDKEWYGVDHTYDGCGWTVGEGDDAGNAIVTEAGTYNIKFYLNSEDGNHIVIEKQGGDIPPEPPVVDPVYALYGVIDWTAENAIVLTQDSEDKNLFTAENIEIAAGKGIKVHNKNADSDKEWYGVDHAYDGCGWTVGTAENDGNAMVIEDGTYKIKFYLNSEDGNHIVIEKKGGDVPPEPVETKTIYLNTKGELDEDGAKLFIHTWGGEEDQDVQFTAVEGQTIILKAEINADQTDYIIVRCSPEAESIVWDGVNFWNKTEDLKFGEFDLIEFDAYDDGTINVTSTANYDPDKTYVVPSDPEPDPEPTELTYTVTWEQDWIFNDNAVVLAWVIDNNDQGKWVETTKVSDNSVGVTVSSEDNIVKIVLVRFEEGTTPESANWDNKYNQTGDITLQEEVYSYNDSSWGN